MDYLATFHTHFDAVKYLKYIKNIAENAILKPVPRKLSSSCGSCVSFTANNEIRLSELHTEELEKLYKVQNREYLLIAENE